MRLFTEGAFQFNYFHIQIYVFIWKITNISLFLRLIFVYTWLHPRKLNTEWKLLVIFVSVYFTFQSPATYYHVPIPIAIAWTSLSCINYVVTRQWLWWCGKLMIENGRFRVFYIVFFNIFWTFYSVRFLKFQ